MWESTPIINYVFNWTAEESKAFQYELMAMYHMPRSKGMKPVEFFKSCFGKQNYTWTGERRNWVWEGPAWRVYVNNVQGLGIEIMTDLTKKQVELAWYDLRICVGLTDDVVRDFKNMMREIAEKKDT